jgi:ATP-dependent Clp protease ATP-binding subunit ClpA
MNPTENRFTLTSQKVVDASKAEARRLNHYYVSTEHILLGLLQVHDGVANEALVNLGTTPSKIRADVERIVGTGDNVMLLGEIPFTPRARKVIELAAEEATKSGSQYTGTEHILIGLVREEEGIAATVLRDGGVRLDDLIREVGRLTSAKLLRGVGSVLKANEQQLKAHDTRPVVARFMRVLMTRFLTLEDMRQAIDDARDSADPVGQVPADALSLEMADRLVDF